MSIKKIIDGREFEYFDNIEFYKGLPIREVNFTMSKTDVIAEVITEKPMEFGVIEIKHVLTLEEYNNSGIKFPIGDKK